MATAACVRALLWRVRVRRGQVAQEQARHVPRVDPAAQEATAAAREATGAVDLAGTVGRVPGRNMAVLRQVRAPQPW